MHSSARNMKSLATETLLLGKIDVLRVFFFGSSFFLSRSAQDKFCTPLTTLKGSLRNGTDWPPQHHRITRESPRNGTDWAPRHHRITPEFPQLLTNRNQAAARHFPAWFGFRSATASVPQWYATGRVATLTTMPLRQGRQSFSALDGAPGGKTNKPHNQG
jgi:hypothetical protein